MMMESALHLLSGGLAGAVTILVGQPFDTVKVSTLGHYNFQTDASFQNSNFFLKTQLLEKPYGKKLTRI